MKHPAAMGEAEVESFLSYLAVVKRVSASTQNQALSALLFLYKDVLGRKLDWHGMPEAACQEYHLRLPPGHGARGKGQTGWRKNVAEGGGSPDAASFGKCKKVLRKGYEDGPVRCEVSRCNREKIPECLKAVGLAVGFPGEQMLQ